MLPLGFLVVVIRSLFICRKEWKMESTKKEVEVVEVEDVWNWDEIREEWSTQAQEVLEEILGLVTE